MAGSILGAVAGGIAGKVANKFLGGDQPQYAGGGEQTVVNKVFIPPYLQDAITKYGNRLSSFLSTPYESYSGERIAPFNSDQQTAFQGVRDSLGDYLPQLQSAMGLNQQVANRALSGFVSPEAISKYMNPYQQGVTDIAKREALRDFDRQMNGIGDFASNAGAFGGDRHAILESEAYRDINQRLDDLQVQGSQSAFDRALQTALQTGVAEAQTLGQSSQNAANLATTAQGYNLNDLAALQQIGGQQQAQEQSLRDFDYQQFGEERGYDYSNLSQFIALTSPLLGTTQNATTSNLNPGLSNASAALAGSTILGPMIGGGLTAGGFTGGFQPYSSPSTGGGINWNSGRSNNIFGGLGNIFGFKKGGRVHSLRHYASGGQVMPGSAGNMDVLMKFLGSLDSLKYTPKREDSRLKRIVGGATNTGIGVAQLPKDIFEGFGGLGEYLSESPEVAKEEREQELRAQEMIDKVQKQSQDAVRGGLQAAQEEEEARNYIKAIKDPEKFGHLMPGLSPEEKQAHLWKVKLNNIAKAFI
jgi:hypothetical protein